MCVEAVVPGALLWFSYRDGAEEKSKLCNILLHTGILNATVTLYNPTLLLSNKYMDCSLVRGHLVCLAIIALPTVMWTPYSVTTNMFINAVKLLQPNLRFAQSCAIFLASGRLRFVFAPRHIKTHLWDLSTYLSKLNIFLKLRNIVLYCLLYSPYPLWLNQ